MQTSSRQPVFRFAPSPNGFLHLGHAFSALLNEKMARDACGSLLLRMEDVDRQRCQTAFEAAILEDLDWLGLRFDGEMRRQSDHAADHQAALDKLLTLGLAYPSCASRSAIAARAAMDPAWPRDPDGALQAPPRRDMLHQAADGAGRQPSHAIRLDLALSAARSGVLLWREGSQEVVCNPALWGDPVLLSRDGSFAYHLAVVVDDALQGVTHVVRGADLRAATCIHRVLQGALGLPDPQYHHHGLIMDEQGEKLAKSRLSPSLRQLRADGTTPQEIRRRFGFG